MRRCRPRTLLAVSALMLACAPAGAGAAPPLVGQWSMDGSYEDAASQVTADSSGNGLGLRAPNGSMHLGTPALFGTGATLGTNLTPMQVTSPLLAPAQLTLLAWIKQSGNPGTLRYLAGRGDDGLTCGGSSYALYTGYPAKPGLRFYARTAGAPFGALTDAPADGTVFDGQWHLVAGTYDGAATRLYVDGVLVGSPIPAAPPLNYSLSGGSAFYVDGYPVEGCSLFVNADDWTGQIDEVRLYDRALSASELTRLAAAGAGPVAPALTPDEAPASPAASGPQPAAAASAGQAIERAALARAADAVAGSTNRALTKPALAALAAAEEQALAAMKSAASSSRVGSPEQAKGLSAKQVKATDPDPRVQARLEAMRFGIATKVQAGAAGELVEAAATVVLEREIAGKIKTQTIVLPPAAGIAEASKAATIQFPVDAKAAAAMAKSDIARAGLSVQAVSVDKLSGLGELQAQRMQKALDAQAKATTTLSNLLNKIADAQQAITQNLGGGVTPAERRENQALKEKQSKLTKDAQAIEKAKDAANQQATQAMQQAVAQIVVGITAGTGGALPTASTALAGCKACQFGALVSK